MKKRKRRNSPIHEVKKINNAVWMFTPEWREISRAFSESKRDYGGMFLCPNEPESVNRGYALSLTPQNESDFILLCQNHQKICNFLQKINAQIFDFLVIDHPQKLVDALVVNLHSGKSYASAERTIS